MKVLVGLGVNGWYVSQFVDEGDRVKIPVRSPFLVSAGQALDLVVSARAYPERQPGDTLLDGRKYSGILPTLIGVAAMASPLPTRRALSDIMADVVRHDEIFPTHGTDCVCMDNFIREVRAQATSSIPCWRDEMDNNSELWQTRFKAQSRVYHVLTLAAKGVI